MKALAWLHLTNSSLLGRRSYALPPIMSGSTNGYPNNPSGKKTGLSKVGMYVCEGMLDEVFL